MSSTIWFAGLSLRGYQIMPRAAFYTPPFSTGSLHDVCIEVMKRHETLMATHSAPVESVNFVKTDRSGEGNDFKGVMFLLR